MPLTQMQYDEIMRGYEQRRTNARHNAQENIRKVREAIPQYRKIEDEITDLAVESARKAIDGDKDAQKKLKEEIEELTKKQKELLKENGFADDFLEEKYECPDCHDTGYISATQKCHCLRQEILRVTYRQSNIDEVLKRENFDTLRCDIYTDAESEKMKGIIHGLKILEILLI